MSWKRLTREEVASAVAESASYRQVMKRLGYRQFAGGSAQYLSKKIKAWGIDTSHMLGKSWNRGALRKGGTPRKGPDEYLIYHSDGTRQRAVILRRSLLEIGRTYECYICGIRKWNDKELVLEIDHKDGDFQNDAEDNLGFICPNCHSQTPTFCRRKRCADMS